MVDGDFIDIKSRGFLVTVGSRHNRSRHVRVLQRSEANRNQIPAIVDSENPILSPYITSMTDCNKHQLASSEKIHDSTLWITSERGPLSGAQHDDCNALRVQFA